MRANFNLLKFFNLIWVVQSPAAEIFRFYPHPNDGYFCIVPARWRGVSRSSRTLGTECDGRGNVTRRMTLLRTAKSCGPDAPTLASSFAEATPRGDGGKKARSPERARRKPLKPLRAGMPGASGGSVVTTRVLSTLRTRGCGCGGHPAFPVPSVFRAAFLPAQLGRTAPRESGRMPPRRTLAVVMGGRLLPE
jgi:hypothetical protein